METILNPVLGSSVLITGEGYASWQGPSGDSVSQLPALIALRLRWDRPWRKDRTLDYDEGTLGDPDQPFGGQLQVHYALSNGETKKVFLEMINKRTGQKVTSERRVFTGVHVLP
jgi:hypothetical protein